MINDNNWLSLKINDYHWWLMMIIDDDWWLMKIIDDYQSEELVLRVLLDGWWWEIDDNW